MMLEFIGHLLIYTGLVIAGWEGAWWLIRQNRRARRSLGDRLFTENILPFKSDQAPYWLCGSCGLTFRHRGEQFTRCPGCGD